MTIYCACIRSQRVHVAIKCACIFLYIYIIIYIHTFNVGLSAISWKQLWVLSICHIAT